jgi:hypothetical protein
LLKVLTEISAFRNNAMSDFSAFPLAIRFFPYMMNLIGTAATQDGLGQIWLLESRRTGGDDVNSSRTASRT